MPSPSPAVAPYPVRLTQGLIRKETVYSTNAIEGVITLTGVPNGILVTFDIPDSNLPARQVVANDFTAYSDGVIDPGAVLSEGTGPGGLDQIIFAVPPVTAATARVVQGQPLNFGNVAFSVQAEEVDRVAYNKGQFDDPIPIPGQKTSQVTFDVPVMGSGVAATPPPMGELLEVCGFSETVAGSKVIYELLQNPNLNSGTVLLFFGNQYRTSRGLRATASMQFTSGQPGVLSATCTGTFDLPVDRGYATGLVDPANEEPLVQLVDLVIGSSGVATQIDNIAGYLAGATVLVVDSTAGMAAGDIVRFTGLGEYAKIVTVDSATQITVTRGHYGSDAVALGDNQAVVRMYKTCGDEFTVDLGNEIATDLCYNAAEGVKGQLFTSRAVVLTVQVRATTEAEKAFWGNFVNGQLDDIAFVMGDAANERVGFMFPACRLTLPEDVDVNENWSLTLNYRAKPVNSEPALTVVQH